MKQEHHFKLWTKTLRYVLISDNRFIADEVLASNEVINRILQRFRSDITHPEEIALQRTRRIATNDDARLIIGIQKEQYISCLKRKASDLLESKRNDRRILLEELRTSTKAAHEFVESKVSDFQSTHLKFIQAAQALSISLSDELKSIYDQSVILEKLSSTTRILHHV